MTSQVITPREWRAQRWANGGGTTHEILRRSARGDREDYDLRVSFADVERPGPFSTFAGYRRWSFLADAPAIELVSDAGPVVKLVALGDHVEQPGMLAVTAALPAGPTHLLNVLARVPVVCGYGPTAHPVEIVVALVPRPDLPHLYARVFERPTPTDTHGCVWIAAGA